MVYVKWFLIIGFWVIFLAFVQYTLPRTQIVYVTGVETKLEHLNANSIFWATPSGTNVVDGKVQRDVRYMDTVKPNGGVRVYRNEDTGWSWPPFFKFNSANLQAEARKLTSNSENPNWVAVRSYGWRFLPMSIYPNAISIWEVDGPDVRIIPWFNIIFLALLATLIWAIRVRWVRFRKRRIDPLYEDVEDRIDAASDAIADRKKRWFGR